MSASGPLSVRLWTGYILSSYNEKTIFRPGSFFGHPVDPKINHFLSYNRPLSLFTNTQLWCICYRYSTTSQLTELRFCADLNPASGMPNIYDNENLWQWSPLCKSVRIRSFSGSYFSVFGLNTDIYRVNLLILSEYGKMRTRKTPNVDIFYAMPDWK